MTTNVRSNDGQVTSDTEYGARTRSRAKVKRSAPKNVPSSSSPRKDYGLPTARDSQGRDLFTRPSDGKLVYLHCCVARCGRTNFPNALALRNHVSSPIGLHKIKGLIRSNTHAIEMCGQVAPGQEEPSTTARDQPFEAAPAVDMTRADTLLSPATGSDEDQHQSEASSRSITDTEAKSSATVSKALEGFKARDLGRAYRTRSSYNGGQTGSRTRAEEAAEVFNGFMSSDSEDSDDNDDSNDSNDSEDGLPQGRKILADRIDQHKAATLATNPSTRFQAGAIFDKQGAETASSDSALVGLAVDAQAIKNERSATPSLFDELSERHASPKRLTAASEAEHVPNNLEAGSIATRKRPHSAPPVTPPAKRLRVTDDKVERLMRS